MKHILPRAAALLLCLTTLLSCASCILLRPVNQDPATVYGKLLAEYAVLLQAHADGEDVTAVESPATKGLSSELFDSLKTLIPETEFENIADMGYAFYDLDSDGTYECFLMNRDGNLYALYACKNGAPYLVEIYRGGTIRQGVLMEDGIIFTMHIFKENDKLSSSEYHYSRFKDGEMVPERSYVIDYLSDTAYAVENGEKRDFSKEENMDLNQQIPANFAEYKLHAKAAGLWFQSVDTLKGEADTETADKPVFDASSYNVLLDSLTAMKPLTESFVYKEWLNGDYDDGMVISSPEDYRVYINLLLSCASNDGYNDTEGEYHPRAIGYAYRDMNADGSDELFILNEDSDLIALLTLREGAPVLLWHSGDSTTNTGMDSEGHLLASRYPSNSFTSIEYFSYELTSECELAPVAYLYGSQYVRKILMDGKVILVDQEAYSAEFKRVFDKNQGEFWTNEWNEGGKMLKFTPLG